MIIDRLLPPSRLQVWAADHESAQIVWGALPEGKIRLEAVIDGGSVSQVELDHPGGPGGLTVTDLPPGSEATLRLSSPEGEHELSAQTISPPPGEPITRFATISDLHLGAERFGLLKTMSEGVEPGQHLKPHPTRCAEAAIAEAVAWGAEFLVIKGDAVDHEDPDDFVRLGQLVDTFPDLPMLMIPGNHDVDAGGGVIPLSVGRRQLPYVRHVDQVRLDGVTIVVGDTTVPGRGYGTIERVGSDLVETVAQTQGPVFLAIHHQLQPGRLPHYWPAGIRAPRSTRFLDQLADLAKPVLVTSGHTHRNRVHQHRGVTVTEVASTKDWPGVWAGYEVFEGGLTQTVRRVESPLAASWHEYSRMAVWGVWSRWSPGKAEDRSFSHAWSDNRHRQRERIGA